MRMTTVAAVLLACVSLLLIGAPPVYAAPGIGLSHDAVTWSERLAHPLFDAEIRWVPGDRRTQRFYVRNETTAQAHLEVDVMSTGVDALLSTDDLRIDARVAQGPWQPIGRGDQVLLAADQIAAAEVWPVDVRVHFVASSTNASQRLPFDLELQVRLVEPVPPSPDPTSVPPRQEVPLADEILAFTGSAVPWWLAALGVAAVAAGVAMRRSQPRSPQEVSDERA